MPKTKKNIVLQMLLWVLQGFIVGLGVILPGVSGGSLLYAFGIYAQILEVLSSPITGIKKYWKMLIFVAIGGAIGFIGFAGIVEWLLGWNESVVVCVFIGLILGTLPGLWKEAGSKGRTAWSFVALALSFVGITVLFYLFEHTWAITVPHNLVGWILCGLIWGLGFVVPGLSSSNLLMFFGVYTVLLGHIKDLNFGVVIPFGLSVLAVFLLLSRVMKLVFDKFHSIISHCVLGFVLATTLMILPSFRVGITSILIYIACIVGGAVASFFFSIFCDKIKATAEASEAADQTLATGSPDATEA